MAKKEFKLSYIYNVDGKQALVTIYTNWRTTAGVSMQFETCEIDYTFKVDVHCHYEGWWNIYKHYTVPDFRLYCSNEFVTQVIKKQTKKITLFSAKEISLELKKNGHLTPRSSDLVDCRLTKTEMVPDHSKGDNLFNDFSNQIIVTKVTK